MEILYCPNARIRALPGSINFNFFVERGIKISYDQVYFFYIFYLRQQRGLKQDPGDIDRIRIRPQGKTGSDPLEKSGSKITKKNMIRIQNNQTQDQYSSC